MCHWNENICFVKYWHISCKIIVVSPAIGKKFSCKMIRFSSYFTRIAVTQCAKCWCHAHKMMILWLQNADIVLVELWLVILDQRHNITLYVRNNFIFSLEMTIYFLWDYFFFSSETPTVASDCFIGIRLSNGQNFEKGQHFSHSISSVLWLYYNIVLFPVFPQLEPLFKSEFSSCTLDVVSFRSVVA